MLEDWVTIAKLLGIWTKCRKAAVMLWPWRDRVSVSVLAGELMPAANSGVIAPIIPR